MRCAGRSRASGADIVTVVHAETSTGVLNPVEAVAAIAREHGALTIVDAVTSLGGHPLEMAAWGIDACYSCAQKCIGAPSGMAPVAFSPDGARAPRQEPAVFYFDLDAARGLLAAPQVPPHDLRVAHLRAA